MGLDLDRVKKRASKTAPYPVYATPFRRHGQMRTMYYSLREADNGAILTCDVSLECLRTTISILPCKCCGPASEVEKIAAFVTILFDVTRPGDPLG